MELKHNFYKFNKTVNINNLISFFYHKCPLNFKFKGEKHDFWEFVFVDKGSMLVTAGDDHHILNAGEIIFHMPNEFHAVEAINNVQSNIIVVAFATDSPCMEFFKNKKLMLTTQEKTYLYEALKYANVFFNNEHRPSFAIPQPSQSQLSAGNTQLVQGHLEILLILILQHNDMTQLPREKTSSQQKSTDQSIAKCINDYLEEHIRKSLTLKKIAKDLGYSVPQLKKIYNHEMKRGIIDTFINMKMDEAKRLMQDGEMNFSEIALYLGYSNVSYFSRLFKKRNDMTPTEYCRSFWHE